MKIFIGGQDRAGTTLLATFFSTVSEKAEVLYETPFKFDYLKTNSLIKWLLIRETKNLKYYRAFGFKRFPNENEVWKLFENDVTIDHTPKNLWYYTSLNQKFTPNDSLFVFVYRNVSSLFSAHKRVDWGIKSPFKFVFWYYLTFYRMKDLAKNDNVIILKFEDILEGQMDYINEKINKKCSFQIKGRKSILLPDYTLSQHDLVNKPLVRKSIELNRIDSILLPFFEIFIRPLVFIINKVLKF